MTDEIPKYSDHIFQTSSIGSESRFGRFFQKVNQFFKKEIPVESHLSGRIQELQSRADSTLVALLEFKNAMEKVAEPQHYSTILNIIDPIIKEIGRIQKAMEQQESATQQVKTFQRYVEWMDKAKIWIALGKSDYQYDNIQKAIVSHSIQEFNNCIDRDIQIIDDYFDNFLNDHELTEVERATLIEQVKPELALHLLGLRQLKQPPEDVSLESLLNWRLQADQSREKAFGSALHVIDYYVSSFMPVPSIDKESEHTEAISAQIKALEENLNQLSASLTEKDLNDEKHVKGCLQVLDKLEDEAHNLNSNLRLTHEQVERVQSVLDILSNLREDLS